MLEGLTDPTAAGCRRRQVGGDASSRSIATTFATRLRSASVARTVPGAAAQPTLRAPAMTSMITGSVTATLIATGNELGQPPVHGTAGGAVVLDPRRCVDEDHETAAGGTSSGTSSIASGPRIATASSRLIG